MLLVVGIVLVVGMIFGGFTLEGGKFDVLAKAAPFELMMIMGSAIGALVISNDMSTIKGLIGGMGKAAGGSKWKKQDYRDLLALLFQLTKLMKTKGVVALEAHIEKPEESDFFKRYPKLLKDHFVCEFICDTLRMMTMNLDDPHQVEEAMDKLLEKHHHEALQPSNAMQRMADGLPALGIVAAVLGIVKTMGAINEPPEVLGLEIGKALTGTFLGVFIAYGFVGPIASRMGGAVEEEAQFYKIIKDVFVAHLHGNAAQVSVEIGRGQVPSTLRPTFAQLEEALNAA